MIFPIDCGNYFISLRTFEVFVMVKSAYRILIERHNISGSKFMASLNSFQILELTFRKLRELMSLFKKRKRKILSFSLEKINVPAIC